MDIVSLFMQIFPIIASAAIAYLTSKFKSYEEKIKSSTELQEKRTQALEGGVRSLLRCRLLIAYNYHMANGWLPKEEIGTINEMFNEYVILGGAKDELKSLIDELMALTHYPPNGETRKKYSTEQSCKEAQQTGSV